VPLIDKILETQENTQNIKKLWKIRFHVIPRAVKYSAISSIVANKNGHKLYVNSTHTCEAYKKFKVDVKETPTNKILKG